MAASMTDMIQLGPLRSQSLLFQFVQISDAYFAGYTFSCNTTTRCNLLDSNLANLRSTVEVE